MSRVVYESTRDRYRVECRDDCDDEWYDVGKYSSKSEAIACADDEVGRWRYVRVLDIDDQNKFEEDADG